MGFLGEWRCEERANWLTYIPIIALSKVLISVGWVLKIDLGNLLSQGQGIEN
jgi:hypothetical protein